MNYIKKIERIERLDKHLKLRMTGSADELARKLNISKRQLFRTIEELKDYGAPIEYSRSLKTFFYQKEFFEIKTNFSIQFITDGEKKNIFGGNFSNKHFRAMFCHWATII
ncbi:MAG TPA: DNA-binding protein [Bacteroidales bacterium]|nr:DNA-binding protein [Bacteroidales bacterium]